MGRLMLAIVAMVVFVAFSLSNTHHVELSFVLGKPVHIRLIFLLAIAFVAGTVSTLFYQMLLENSRRAQLRKTHLRLRKAADEDLV